MESKIVILNSINPYTNIAREYSYYENLQSDEMYFILWQNEPCVVIGRNQNIYQELDLVYMKQQGILPVRRFTGGGGVYQDLGNLNFTFISNQKSKALDTWMCILLNALKKKGIEAEKSGRNDLLVDGKKVSGMAWLEDEEKFLFHGTFMVDLDLTKLSKALTPDMSKFIGKGIKSVKSRVVNLKEISPLITVERLKSSLIEALKEKYPNAKLMKHTVHLDELAICELLKSKEWIFGKKEKAQIQRILTVEGKPLSLDMTICHDSIENVEVYTDCLDLNKIEKIKSTLIGKVYSNLNIEMIVKSIWTNSCL